MTSLGALPPPDYWSEWPVGTAGVFVGGCIRTGVGQYPSTPSEHSDAHSHIARTDPWRGWVCFRDPSHVFQDDGLPSYLLIHELCHVMLRQGHTKKWSNLMRVFGFEENLVPQTGTYQRWS